MFVYIMLSFFFMSTPLKKIDIKFQRICYFNNSHQDKQLSITKATSTWINFWTLDWIQLKWKKIFILALIIVKKMFIGELVFLMFQEYTIKNKWRPGRKWWMQYTRRELLFFVNFGMLAEHLIKVLAASYLNTRLVHSF